MSPDVGPSDTRFIADRMLGTLTRYLRFMGYDTISANGFSPGNAQEDNLLLFLARDEHRVLLTRDHELARRGDNLAVLVTEGDVLAQVQQLIDLGLIKRQVLMSRCSLCNSVLREATEDEIRSSEYAPRDRSGFDFHWCERCRKLYWNGSHGQHLFLRIQSELDF